MTKTIFLAGGCFWGTQHYLNQIEGIIETQTGFANGTLVGAYPRVRPNTKTTHWAYPNTK